VFFEGSFAVNITMPITLLTKEQADTENTLKPLPLHDKHDDELKPLFVNTHTTTAAVEEGVSQLFPSSSEIYFTAPTMQRDDDTIALLAINTHTNSLHFCVQLLLFTHSPSVSFYETHSCTQKPAAGYAH